MRSNVDELKLTLKRVRLIQIQIGFGIIQYVSLLASLFALLLYKHPLQTTCAHVPNLHMGNLVQGIFGAKFVNFWDALAGNAGISLILCYIMVCNGHVSDPWCVKVFYVYKFELIWGGRP